jgi:hypothetical protein
MAGAMKTGAACVRFALILGSLGSMVAACSSGSSTNVGDAGASGSSGGASGASGTGGGASGSSGGASGTSGGGPCAEFRKGGQTDPAIGGSAESQVIVQSVADIAGAASAQLTELTAACKKLAVALGAPSSSQTAADAQVEASDRVKAWCSLAVSAVDSARAKAGGTLDLVAAPSVCKFAAATKGACQARCSGAPCDLAAHPVRCTGGNLAGGFCEDGKLEGGCVVAVKCDASCDVTVIASAACNTPKVTVSISGAVDPAAGALAKSAIEANLPPILALDAHLTSEARIASTVSAVAGEILDIKVACIPAVVASAQVAVSEIYAGAGASLSVVNSVR